MEEAGTSTWIRKLGAILKEELFRQTTREDWGEPHEHSRHVYEPYENERRSYLSKRNVYSSPDDRPEYQVYQVEQNDRRSTRRRQDTIKLNKFDGGTSGQPLEAFLVQFDNAASFNNWSINDCLSHLKASLSGSASQLLWESPAHHFTFTELVERLKQRFGSAGQSAQHRAMLKTRRRGKQESLQTLYADVCKLLSLAYPNQFDLPTTQEVGIDNFLEAIDDPSLERRIREKEFSSLDETFRYCLKLEAYDKAIAIRSEPKKQIIHPARQVQSDGAMETIQKQLEQLISGQKKS